MSVYLKLIITLAMGVLTACMYAENVQVYPSRDFSPPAVEDRNEARACPLFTLPDLPPLPPLPSIPDEDLANDEAVQAAFIESIKEHRRVIRTTRNNLRDAWEDYIEQCPGAVVKTD